MRTIVRQTKKYVQKIVEKGQIEKDFAVLIQQVVFGILKNKSVHLSNIARALNEKQPLIKTEKRLSLGMADTNYNDDDLRHGYLKAVSPTLNRCRYFIGDTTDLSKPYGKAFEYLDKVRDASSKDKHIEPGYWSICLEATTDCHKNVPIDLQVFSTKDPSYQGWYETIEASLVRSLPHVPKSAEHLFDRGFDDIKIMRLLNRQRRFWTIRQKQNRNIVVAGKTRLMSDFVQGLRKPYSGCIPYVDKFTHLQSECFVRFNWAPLELPQLDGKYTLIVADIGHKDPMVLLTNRRVNSEHGALRLVRAYLRRWGVEEGIRLLKQKVSLEDFRVRSMVSICRLALMAMLSYGYVSLLVHHCPQAAQRLMNKLKVFIPVVLFPYYRLFDAVAQELSDRI